MEAFGLSFRLATKNIGFSFREARLKVFLMFTLVNNFPLNLSEMVLG